MFWFRANPSLKPKQSCLFLLESNLTKIFILSYLYTSLLFYPDYSSIKALVWFIITFYLELSKQNKAPSTIPCLCFPSQSTDLHKVSYWPLPSHDLPWFKPKVFPQEKGQLHKQIKDIINKLGYLLFRSCICFYFVHSFANLS